MRLAPEALPDPGPDPRAYGAALAAGLFADPRLREAVAAARGRPRRPGPRCGCACAWPPAPRSCTAWPGRPCWTPGRWTTRRGRASGSPGSGCSCRATWTAPTPAGTSGAPAARCGPWSPWPPRRTPRPSAWTPWTPRPRSSGPRRPWPGSPRWCWAAARAARRRAWPELAAALRDGPDVLYLVCHGSSPQGRPVLWLEREDGTGERVAGEELAQALEGLPRRPALVVLASCQSAGRTHDPHALAALGPRLAQAGVGAVVAMQGDVTQATAGRFLAAFFAELQRDGLLDRAAGRRPGPADPRPPGLVGARPVPAPAGRAPVGCARGPAGGRPRGRAGPARPPADARPRPQDLDRGGAGRLAARGRPAGAGPGGAARRRARPLGAGRPGGGGGPPAAPAGDAGRGRVRRLRRGAAPAGGARGGQDDAAAGAVPDPARPRRAGRGPAHAGGVPPLDLGGAAPAA